MRIQRGGADPPLWMSLRFCLPSDDEKGSLFPLEQIEQRNKMAAKPVFPLLMSMAFPPMLSMLVQSMYNIVDSMFVARFSQDALTAVSLAFPLQNLVLAVAGWHGVGVNSYISRKLGAQDQDAANAAVTHGFLLSFAHAVFFVIFGLVAIRPFFRLFTDSAEIFSLACDYSYIVVLGAFAQLFHIMVEKLLQATGRMLAPMLLQGNRRDCQYHFRPDPDLWFVWRAADGRARSSRRHGVGAGAFDDAFAVGVFLAGSGCAYGSKKIQTRSTCRRPDLCSGRAYYADECAWLCAGNAAQLDLDPFFRVGGVCVWRVFQIADLCVYAGQRPDARRFAYHGLQLWRTEPKAPACNPALRRAGGGGDYGGREPALCLMPDRLLLLFDASPDMLGIGVPALRIISCSYVFAAIGLILSNLFQAVGKGAYSLTVFLMRQLIVVVPLAFLLSRTMGLNGIWVAFPIAEAAGAVAAALFFLIFRRKDAIFHQAAVPQPEAGD